MDKSNCSNRRCRKKLTNFFSCKQCSKYYCSKTCLNTHNVEEHKIPNQLQKPQEQERSVFMKGGQFLTEITYDSFYDKNNFEFVKKMGKNHLLGEGAYAQIYLGKNKLNNKNYAIKVMKKDKLLSYGVSPDIVSREVYVHRRLIHDNIVSLYNNYEDNDNYYMILDYANGGSLFSKIKKCKRGLDEDTSFRYFIQAASSIAFLHENNIVHRDIKPENFLTYTNGIVQLCDFGSCRDVNDEERRTFCGTYEYMAPEMVQDQPYSFGIDVWALGILLYELTHGYSPFRAQSKKVNPNNEEWEEIFKNIVKYNFTIDKPLSKNLCDLITKLLTPQRNKRLRAKDIFDHPWIKEYEMKYHKMKENKEKEQNSNLSPSMQLSNGSYINNSNNSNISNNSNGLNSNNNSKETNDFSLFNSENVDIKEEKNNKLKRLITEMNDEEDAYTIDSNINDNIKNKKNNKIVITSMANKFNTNNSLNKNDNSSIDKISTIKGNVSNAANENIYDKNNSKDYNNKENDFMISIKQAKIEIQEDPSTNYNNTNKYQKETNNKNLNNTISNKNSLLKTDEVCNNKDKVNINLDNSNNEAQKNQIEKNKQDCDFSISKTIENNDLFDNVLNQVLKKNKTKKTKKNKIVTSELNSSRKISSHQSSNLFSENSIKLEERERNSKENIIDNDNQLKMRLNPKYLNIKEAEEESDNSDIKLKSKNISNVNTNINTNIINHQNFNEDILSDDYVNKKKKELLNKNINKEFLIQEEVMISESHLDIINNRNIENNYNNKDYNKYLETNNSEEQDIYFNSNSKNKVNNNHINNNIININTNFIISKEDSNKNNSSNNMNMMNNMNESKYYLENMNNSYNNNLNNSVYNSNYNKNDYSSYLDEYKYKGKDKKKKKMTIDNRAKEQIRSEFEQETRDLITGLNNSKLYDDFKGLDSSIINSNFTNNYNGNNFYTNINPNNDYDDTYKNNINYKESKYNNNSNYTNANTNTNTKNTNLSSNKTGIKDLKRELDLSFLPKDYLYNDMTYDQSNNEILQAINILEDAQNNKERRSMMNRQRIRESVKNREKMNDKKKEEKSFFSDFFSVFKCGQN